MCACITSLRLGLLLSLATICCGKNATLVLLKDAVNQGAVCLDGSAPGYYIRQGMGAGSDKWILHLEGGAWCGDQGDCLNRSKTALGSSTFWPPSVELAGFLSDNTTVNPDFYDWNIVFLMYCDGSSFSSNRIDPIEVNGTNIYFRGRPILEALLNNLLANGMKASTDVILTGCSAGGLATFLQADYVGSILPQNVKYRAFADAGYFLDVQDIYGTLAFRKDSVYALYLFNATGGINQDCIKNYTCLDEWKCFFAPYSFPFIKTRMFIANSLYDTAQLEGLLQLGCLPPNCPPEKMKFFLNFRTEFLEQLAAPLASKTTGIFADSCLVHCQTLFDETWTQFRVGNQSLRTTFADWYNDVSGAKTQEVDCVFPCNPTCPVPHRPGKPAMDYLPF